MSEFCVRVEVIGEVRNHPNADRLDIATLEGIGFQFVVGRGEYKPGDRVLYFPLDAIIPDGLATKLGLLGKLGGKAKNRVKTIKLRGEISQGVVGRVTILTEDAPSFTAFMDKRLADAAQKIADGADPAILDEEVDFAEFLGVTKYEPDDVNSGGPNAPRIKVNPLPPEVRKYDIEGCQRFKDQLDTLMDTDVVITEKLEGSHCAVLRRRDGEIVYCSRNCTLVDADTHFHKGVAKSKILDNLEHLASIYDGHDLIVRGELIGPGIQGNIYGLTEPEFRLFEFEVDGRPVDAKHVYDYLFDQYQYVAPVLWADGTLREWLALVGCNDVIQASNGRSVFGKTLREGIVIKPFKEMHDRKLGRLFLKQRSPEYLATHDS